MHKRGAVQSVVGTLVPQVVVGQTTQLVINQRQEGIQGATVTSPPALQQLYDPIRSLMRH
jgi:hypothetical protein